MTNRFTGSELRILFQPVSRDDQRENDIKTFLMKNAAVKTEARTTPSLEGAGQKRLAAHTVEEGKRVRHFGAADVSSVSALAHTAKVPCVLLARPGEPSTIGCVINSMLSFGLCDLRLAAPKVDHTSDQVMLHAPEAAPRLRGVSVYESISEAVSGLQLVLATTIRPQEVGPDFSRPSCAH